MKIVSKDQSPRELYQLLISCIVPRPIAFVSTVSPDGKLNAAPFSFFSGLSSSPPSLTIAIGKKKGDVKKDTLINIEATGEFVVNVVTGDMAEAMVKCSGEYPYGENELEISGLQSIASDLVKAPRIKESPIQMECRLLETVNIQSIPSTLVIGEILIFHIDDKVLKDGSMDMESLQPLARLHEDRYSGLTESFSIPRPHA